MVKSKSCERGCFEIDETEDIDTVGGTISYGAIDHCPSCGSRLVEKVPDEPVEDEDETKTF